MSLAEVMTCVKEKIPAIAIVFNNNQWGAEKKNQIDYFESRFVGTPLTNPDFSGSRAHDGRRRLSRGARGRGQ